MYKIKLGHFIFNLVFKGVLNCTDPVFVEFVLDNRFSFPKIKTYT